MLMSVRSRHVNGKHNKQYQCSETEECTEIFGLKADLSRHVREVHQKEQVYYCPYHGCKKSEGLSTGFSREKNRDRHVETRHSISGTHLFLR
jgi:uncharacterized Zn-finger protein